MGEGCRATGATDDAGKGIPELPSGIVEAKLFWAQWRVRFFFNCVLAARRLVLVNLTSCHLLTFHGSSA